MKNDNLGQHPGAQRVDHLLLEPPGNAEIEPEQECGDSCEDKHQNLHQMQSPPVETE
jgi:hypothetical protein